MVLNREYVVYIMASSTGTLYLGMTGFFSTRVGQHKAGEMEGFSRTYPCDRLVYCEGYDNVNKSNKPREAAQALDPRGKNRFDREPESAVEGSG